MIPSMSSAPTRDHQVAYVAPLGWSPSGEEIGVLPVAQVGLGHCGQATRGDAHE
jgi:hypothetical protein